MFYKCDGCFLCFTFRKDCESHMDVKRHRTSSSVETVPEGTRGLTDDGHSGKQLQRSLSLPSRLAQSTQVQNAYYTHTSVRYNPATGLTESVDSYHSVKPIMDTTDKRAMHYGCGVCERKFRSLLGVNQHMDVMDHWPQQSPPPQPASPGHQYMGIVVPERDLRSDRPWPAMPGLEHDFYHDSIDVKNQFYPEEGIYLCHHVSISNMIVNTTDFDGMENFMCKTCDRSFTTAHGAIQHMDVMQHWSQPLDQQRHHAYNRTNTGPKMNARTQERGDVKPPKLARLRKQVAFFKCDTCERVFNTQDGVIQHMAVKSHRVQFKCGTRKRSFNTEDGALQHMVVKGHRNIYGCDICGCDFGTQSQLEQHMATHDSPLPAIKHERYVPFETDIPCEICHLVFSTAGDTDKHMSEVHFCQECSGLITGTNLHMECTMRYVETFWQSQCA
ncbi:hypothetical protein PENANT_c007G07936 [Penicillium antarcticum]|uniref:C2H2-type domain-containing protein n=1 Tax=Penicillium antarcticum TaxID=416450 RepID=A0A1V6QBW4_9EURO|nr:hypothetical protein PENANT_c007G07936 [Penicillium antarcticum]